MEKFKVGGYAWIIYHHEVVKAQIVSIDKKYNEIEFNYFDPKENCLWVGIRRNDFNCFITREEAEKYQKKLSEEYLENKRFNNATN